tara:strand:+ start:213 stop:506 length:294 start_codon:yes stop_codon:yes gene_type:complete
MGAGIFVPSVATLSGKFFNCSLTIDGCNGFDSISNIKDGTNVLKSYIHFFNKNREEEKKREKKRKKLISFQCTETHNTTPNTIASVLQRLVDVSLTF